MPFQFIGRPASSNHGKTTYCSSLPKAYATGLGNIGLLMSFIRQVLPNPGDVIVQAESQITDDIFGKSAIPQEILAAGPPDDHKTDSQYPVTSPRMARRASCPAGFLLLRSGEFVLGEPPNACQIRKLFDDADEVGTLGSSAAALRLHRYCVGPPPH